MYSRFEGYHPDIDQATPGLITDGENIIPSPGGYRSAYTPVNASSSALTATCVGAVSLIDLAGNVLTYAGTATQLYKEDSDHWTGVTRAAGDYTSGASWAFAQYGNATYAVNDAAVMQKSTGGVFADVSGAPVAKIVVVAQNQVLAFDTNEATFGDQSNRWWCSALGNGDSWIPSIATQAASGQLVDTSGAILAALRLGERVVAYKANSMYLGSYIGPPSVWAWPLVSDEIGCVGLKAATSVDNVHFFMGTDDFYVFSGTYPQGIGGTIREFFFQNEINRDYLSSSIAVHNRKQGLVYFFYVSVLSTGPIDRYIAYHVATKKWSPPTAISPETAFEYISSAITYDTLGDFFATYDDLPAIPYDSEFWVAQANKTAVFNTSNRLQTLDEPASSMSISTWSIGDDSRYSFFKRLRPRFKKYPTSGTLINAYRENHGDDWVSSSVTSTLADGKFDFERESRWHTARMDFSGDTEISGIDPSIEGAGDE
jgi:hypothetical protein